MKIRIMGTKEEVQQMSELLPAIMKVSSVSGEYPNRNSNDVRVYVDGKIEDTPYTQAMKQFAEFKEQVEAMTIIAANSKGQIFEVTASTHVKSYLLMLSFLVGEKFHEFLKENVENFAESQGLNLEKLENMIFEVPVV